MNCTYISIHIIALVPQVFKRNASTKVPIRPIKSLLTAEKDHQVSKKFTIICYEKTKKRSLNYEAQTPALASEIVAKLKFLMVFTYIIYNSLEFIRER